MKQGKTEEATSQVSMDISKIENLLTQLSTRIGSIERKLSNIEDITKKLPAVIAVATDSIDEHCRNAAKSGIDIGERFKKMSELLIQITDPKKIDALSQVINNIENLASLLKQLERVPDILAVIVDSFDELCKDAERSGIDFELVMKQGKDAASKLNELLKSDELKALMNSGILNSKAVNIVAQAGCALAECKEARPEKIGIIGLIKALGNCDIQCALGFLISFGKRFGRLLNNN